jgi:hypothetical protein
MNLGNRKMDDLALLGEFETFINDLKQNFIDLFNESKQLKEDAITKRHEIESIVDDYSITFNKVIEFIEHLGGISKFEAFLSQVSQTKALLEDYSKLNQTIKLHLFKFKELNIEEKTRICLVIQQKLEQTYLKSDEYSELFNNISSFNNIVNGTGGIILFNKKLQDFIEFLETMNVEKNKLESKIESMSEHVQELETNLNNIDIPANKIFSSYNRFFRIKEQLDDFQKTISRFELKASNYTQDQHRKISNLESTIYQIFTIINDNDVMHSKYRSELEINERNNQYNLIDEKLSSSQQKINAQNNEIMYIKNHVTEILTRIDNPKNKFSINYKTILVILASALLGGLMSTISVGYFGCYIPAMNQSKLCVSLKK